MILYWIIFTICVMVISFMTGMLFKKIQSENSSEELFDQVYLINLKRRPDRLNNFMEYYNASDMNHIQFVKFEAIDGSQLDIERVPLSELARAELKEIENTGFRSKHYQLTKGAIGCYLSHVKIWEDIMQKGHNIALILEDDAKVPSDILNKINRSIVEIPVDWDIVLLGYLCTKCVNYNSYNKVERFMLTHSYLITRTAIDKILQTKSLFPITQQIDAYMSELSSVLNIYTVDSKMIPQFKSRTDIQAPLKDKKAQEVNDRIRVLNSDK